MCESPAAMRTVPAEPRDESPVAIETAPVDEPAASLAPVDIAMLPVEAGEEEAEVDTPTRAPPSALIVPADEIATSPATSGLPSRSAPGDASLRPADMRTVR